MFRIHGRFDRGVTYGGTLWQRFPIADRPARRRSSWRIFNEAGYDARRKITRDNAIKLFKFDEN